VRGRTSVEFKTDYTSYERRLRQPSYKRDLFHTTKDDGALRVIAFEMAPRTVNLNKAVYVGACILDLSKLHMQRFHYDVIRAKYGQRARLCFTDTDSLCYHIATKDVYSELFASHADEMDYSPYAATGRIDFGDYDKDQHKKITGKFKDECEMGVMREFRGLRSKVYRFGYLDEHGTYGEKGTCKGVNRAVAKGITLADYNACATTKQSVFRTNTRFQKHQHRITTVHQQRKCLAAYDDKRYILDDGVTTLAYGHWRIKQLQEVQ
jgi:hypothetical protein